MTHNMINSLAWFHDSAELRADWFTTGHSCPN